MHKQGSDESCLGLRHEQANGISFVERPGPGPAVLFLHGIGSNAHSFETLFKHMPATLRLIAWNAPGYLSSDGLKVQDPQAADYAGALERLLGDLGLDTVHLVGHSLGSLVAAAFAERAPERIASLTLAASAQGYGIEAGAPLSPKVAKRLDDLAELGAEKFAETRAPRLVFEPDLNPSVVERVRTQMARINPEGYAQAVHMLASGDLAKSVARVRRKPGFIVGSEDRVTPIEQTIAAADAWDAAYGEAPRIVSIPDAGHAVYVQEPRQFADALLELAPELAEETSKQVEGEPHGR